MLQKARTLALGSLHSAHYQSLKGIMYAFGDVECRNEKEFRNPNDLLVYLRHNKFDQVLLPNPYGNPERLKCYRMLREEDFPVVVSDRGALPDSWFFDHGFNFDSPSYAPTEWDAPLTDAQKRRVRAYMKKLRSGNAALEKQGPRVPGEELRRRLGLEGKKILFVPLQRPYDTVVRYFSGAVGSLEDLVMMAGEIERMLNANGHEEWQVVLKKHPLETDYIVPTNPRLKYVTNDVHVHDMLSLSDAVLVLNSGVGVLSLIFGNPTLHVGDAFYGHPGLAARVCSPAEAALRIRQCPTPDKQKVERFIHHLITRVYSFGKFKTDQVRQRDGSYTRVTRHISFRELRILGRDVAVPDGSVLVVSPVIPWPIYRGSQARVDMVTRALMDNHKRVSLCVLNTSFDKPSKAIVSELRQVYPGLDRISVRKHPKFDKGWWGYKHKAERAAERARGSKHRVANLETCPLNFRRAVAELCDEINPDYLLINYAKLAPCIPRDYRGVTIIDTHDYQTKFLEEDQNFNGVRKDIDRELFRKSEHAALQRFDRVVAINPVEKQLFERIVPPSRVYCVPAFSEPRPSRDIFLTHSYDALFVASMSNFNVTGLEWFIRRVLPRIVAERPSFRLSVVGNINRAPKLDTNAHPQVDFHGVVPELSDFYEQSRIVIAPILGGAGMKIKVVEALGYAKATVCTSKAAEGIGIGHRREAWIADTPDEFAEGVLSLCGDESLRSEVERNALDYHARHHSPGAVREALRAVLAGPPAGIDSAPTVRSEQARKRFSLWNVR